MTTSYGALCSDFYVNIKLGLKMDLPEERQTILDLFDRVRRECPSMSRFRRFRGELALESSEDDGKSQWLALRRNTLRAGVVNPAELEDACRVHRSILTVAPYFLSISPLDVDYVEALFGFDFEAEGNQNRIVQDALLSGTPLGNLLELDGASPIDIQPFLGLSLSDAMDMQAYFEVKTRSTPRQMRAGDATDEPISVYVTMRKYGPIDDVTELPVIYDALCAEAEKLAQAKVLPCLIQPLREAIAQARF